jgi:hypothetical protein
MKKELLRAVTYVALFVLGAAGYQYVIAHKAEKPYSESAHAKHDRAAEIVNAVTRAGARLAIEPLKGSNGVLEYSLSGLGWEGFGFFIDPTIPASNELRQTWLNCRDGDLVTLKLREGMNEDWSISRYLIPTCSR